MQNDLPSDDFVGDAHDAPSISPTLHALDAARDAARNVEQQMQAMVQAQEAKQTRLAQELETARREQSEWRSRWESANAEAEQLRQQLQAAKRRANDLHDDILQLYTSLRTGNLPLLILSVSMKLTGAEQGLYVDESGEKTVAEVGIAEMTHVPRQALYAFTREAADTDAPLIRNDSVNLPDGPQLVNLAAVPVTLRGVPAGVIMVANKRSGPFTEQDTEALLSVGRHGGAALENQRLHRELAEAYLQTIAVLADAIMAKDPYTRGHCEEVSVLAVRVAEHMGISGDALDEIRYAALLHDVGKIGVSDGILLKPGRLLPEERSVIERHAQIGSDLVSRVAALAPIVPVIRHHHERVDGKGYPEGLTGDNIPLAARIIGAVDALDAMTSPRPYRNPISRAEALVELRRCAGEQFDSQVVAAVEQLLAPAEQPQTVHAT